MQSPEGESSWLREAAWHLSSRACPCQASVRLDEPGEEAPLCQAAPSLGGRGCVEPAGPAPPLPHPSVSVESLTAQIWRPNHPCKQKSSAGAKSTGSGARALRGEVGAGEAWGSWREGFRRLRLDVPPSQPLPGPPRAAPGPGPSPLRGGVAGVAGEDLA